MDRLHRTHTSTDGPVVAVALAGTIDETFTPDILKETRGQILILDLADITRVTSFGVREWIRGFGPIVRARPTFFINASPPMMDQFNMVHGFDCGGQLLTFFAGYTCEACGETTLVLVDMMLDRHNIDTLKPPHGQCAVCGTIASLDDDAAVLFEYARSVNPPVPPREVSAFFRGEKSTLALPPGSRVRVTKSATNEGTAFAIAGCVDGTFPVRSIISGCEGKVHLDFTNTVSFADGGLARWREVVTGLAEGKCDVRLSSVTPPALRIFADNPGAVAGLHLDSVSLPIDWTTEHTHESKIVPIGQLDKALMEKDGGRNKAWRLRGDPAMFKDLVVRVTRGTHSTAAAAPRHLTGNSAKRKWARKAITEGSHRHDQTIRC